MESMKHKMGIILLVISLAAVLAAIWYLLFGITDGSGFEGGVLVEAVKRMMTI